MIFTPTKIPGVFEIEPELKEDERGYFTRIFCEEEFKEQGIDFHTRQANRSFTKRRGTIRGMHYQEHPKWEPKLFTVVAGKLFTIVADIRPDSPTFKQWIGIELSAESKKMIFTPVGCANGFQTLADNCEVLYLMSEFYSPEHARGFSYKDPQFNFQWPLGGPTVVSSKDAALPNFEG